MVCRRVIQRIRMDLKVQPVPTTNFNGSLGHAIGQFWFLILWDFQGLKTTQCGLRRSTKADSRISTCLTEAQLCYYNCNNVLGAGMIKLKVRKFGNSLGVVLPREVINRLRTNDGEPLYLLESPDGSYQLTQYDPEFEKKMSKADDIMQRYRNTLHELAK